MTADQRLKELGLTLPLAPAPVGSYVPAVRTGNLVFVSGQLPMRDGRLMATGKVGGEVTLDEAQACARQAALNALAVAAAEAGGLAGIARIVRLTGHVASAAGFTDQAKVANGASELLGDLFGQVGRHTRCAVGVAELPANAPVEIDAVVLLGA